MNSPVVQVDLNLACSINRLRCAAVRIGRSSKSHTNPCQHFSHGNRFSDEVVGSGVKCCDLLAFVGVGGVHNDRNVRLCLPYLSDYSNSVALWKTWIEHDQIE